MPLKKNSDSPAFLEDSSNQAPPAQLITELAAWNVTQDPANLIQREGAARIAGIMAQFSPTDVYVTQHISQELSRLEMSPDGLRYVLDTNQSPEEALRTLFTSPTIDDLVIKEGVVQYTAD